MGDATSAERIDARAEARIQLVERFDAAHRIERALNFISYPVDTSIKARGWDCRTDRESVEYLVQILRGEE